MPNQHVIPHAQGWAVKPEGGERASSVHGTQEEAVRRATELAEHQRSEVLVHGKDGQIRMRNSYGNDPRHRPG
jgi:uncharacterized protein YdaT